MAIHSPVYSVAYSTNKHSTIIGVREAEVCARCRAEYISKELMYELETEVKRRDLFGLERRGMCRNLENSLVIRVPKEITDSLKIRREMPVIIYLSDSRNSLSKLPSNVLSKIHGM